MTEEERYLMEERRKRQAARQGQRHRSVERTVRPSRTARREDEMQKSMNDYYDNYMQIREQRQKGERPES